MDHLHALLLALLLGMQHGVDPDHLTAIDGLTRFNARIDRRRARWCGLWFSLGHGTLVTLATLVVATLSYTWHMPPWVDRLFGWFTIALLVAIGAINLLSLRHSHASGVAAGGIRSRLLRGLLGSQHLGAIFGVGVLFALSFETMTQASVFALGAGGASGSVAPAAVEGALIWWLPLALGITFTAGMIVTDSVNGLWLYRLASNTQARSASATRRLALAIAMLSFAMAGWAAARMLSPEIDAWFEGSELLLGLAVLAVVASGYLLAMRTGAPVAPDATALITGDRR